MHDMGKLIIVIAFFVATHSLLSLASPNILWIYVDDMSGWLDFYL